MTCTGAQSRNCHEINGIKLPRRHAHRARSYRNGRKEACKKDGCLPVFLKEHLTLVNENLVLFNGQSLESNSDSDTPTKMPSRRPEPPH